MARPQIEIDPEKVLQLAARGLTEQQIADVLGISTDTFGRRKKQYAEFREAVKKGRAEGIASAANQVLRQAVGGNLTAAIFYLKCKGGWRERDEIPSEEPRKIAADIRIALKEMDEKTAPKPKPDPDAS